MSCQESYRSVCTIVLDVDDAHQIENVVTFLEAADISIDEIDRDNGVIKCCGESGVMHGLSKQKLFGYVRIEMTYHADPHPNAA
jgi:hypothetical protein